VLLIFIYASIGFFVYSAAPDAMDFANNNIWIEQVIDIKKGSSMNINTVHCALTQNPLMQFRLKSIRVDSYSFAGGGLGHNYYVYPLYMLEAYLKVMTSDQFERQNPVSWLFTHSLIVDARKGVFSQYHSLVACKGVTGGDVFFTHHRPKIIEDVCSIQWQNASAFGYNSFADCNVGTIDFEVKEKSKICSVRQPNLWSWALHFVRLVFNNNLISNEAFCKALIQFDDNGKSGLCHVRTYLDFLYVDREKKTPDLRIMSFILIKVENILNDNAVPSENKLRMVVMMAVGEPGCDSILMKMLKDVWAKSKLGFFVDPLLEVLGSRKYSADLFGLQDDNWLSAICSCVVAADSDAAIDQVDAILSIYAKISADGHLFKRHINNAVAAAIGPYDQSALVVEKLLSHLGYKNSCELLFQNPYGSALEAKIAKARDKINATNYCVLLEDVLLPYRLSTVFHYLKEYARSVDIKSNGRFQSYLPLSTNRMSNYLERKVDFIAHVECWLENQADVMGVNISSGQFTNEYKKLIGSCQFKRVSGDVLAGRIRHIFQGLYNLATAAKDREMSPLVLELCDELISKLAAKIPSIIEFSSAHVHKGAAELGTTQTRFSFQFEQGPQDLVVSHGYGGRP
jgi:hypothetical protein